VAAVATTVVRDFIFLDDVVDALVAASADRGSGRIFNVGSGVGHSLRAIIAAIERQLGRRLATKSTAGRPLDVPVSVLEIDLAKELLKWIPRTSLKEGLQRTINWWSTSK
jgi:UDP-glucose 4-epimerase